MFSVQSHLFFFPDDNLIISRDSVLRSKLLDESRAAVMWKWGEVSSMLPLQLGRCPIFAISFVLPRSLCFSFSDFSSVLRPLHSLSHCEKGSVVTSLCVFALAGMCVGLWRMVFPQESGIHECPWVPAFSFEYRCNFWVVFSKELWITSSVPQWQTRGDKSSVADSA